MASERATSENLPHVVIVGGGFGGLSAAKKLNGAPVKVTVIDSSNHHLFQPLLYQVATAGLSPAEIASPIRHILHHQKNAEVFLEKVTDIDTQKRVVKAGGAWISYDFLIVATGARHGYFGHDDWEKFAPGLKSISDATKIRRNILLAFERAERETDPAAREALLTFCIIGGGPTGVEMAGAIAELAQRALATDFRHVDPTSAKIILVEAGPRILAGFPEDLSARATEGLHRLKVDVRTQSRVSDIKETGIWIGKEFLPSRTVIWAAGVVASPAGQWLKVPTDHVGRVVVNQDCSVPGLENVFVIGDTAHFEHGGKLLPGVSPVAMQQGRYVASLIRSRVGGRGDVGPFRYVDKGSMATVGRSFAVAQVRKIHLSGLTAWWVWLLIHIYFLIGFKNRLIVFIQWAWAYLTFQRGARLIVTEENPPWKSDWQSLD